LAEWLFKLAQFGGGARPRDASTARDTYNFLIRGTKIRDWPTILRSRKIPFPGKPKKYNPKKRRTGRRGNDSTETTHDTGDTPNSRQRAQAAHHHHSPPHGASTNQNPNNDDNAAPGPTALFFQPTAGPPLLLSRCDICTPNSAPKSKLREAGPNSN
jgi:hypothetical protein